MNNTTLKTIPLCVSALLLGACAHRVTEREVVREQPVVQAQAPQSIMIVQPPAAPQEAPTPAPSTSGYSWVPGHYVWHGDRWDWEAGRWVAGQVRSMPAPLQETPTTPPASGGRWIPGYWTFSGNDWVWTRGHWE